MTLRRHIEITQELLVRFVVGETSPEEARAILRWANERLENQTLLDSFREVQRLSGQALRDRRARTLWQGTRAWDAVTGRIAEGEVGKGASPPASDAPDRSVAASTSTPRRRRIPAPGLRAAASILLLVVGGAAGAWLYQTVSTLSENGRVFVAERGQRAEIRLTDGTRVVLDADSRIRVLDDFGDELRSVELVGQAYFDVESMPRLPFLVRANGTVTRVVGTEFNVRAYVDEETVEVVVAEGKVTFDAKEGSSAPSTPLVVGEMATLWKADGLVKVTPVDLGPKLAWTRGRFIFEDTPLSDVMNELARRYGLTFRTSDPKLASLRFTGDFGIESLREMVDVIAFTLNLRASRSADTVTFFPREEVQ